MHKDCCKKGDCKKEFGKKTGNDDKKHGHHHGHHPHGHGHGHPPVKPQNICPPKPNHGGGPQMPPGGCNH